jgi:hypothetical protein
MVTEQPARQETCRPLEDGERALRRKCIDCGDTHQALWWAGGSWLQECRVCGALYGYVVKPRRR